jgi:hypothetical protein
MDFLGSHSETPQVGSDSDLKADKATRSKTTVRRGCYIALRNIFFLNYIVKRLFSAIAGLFPYIPRFLRDVEGLQNIIFPTSTIGPSAFTIRENENAPPVLEPAGRWNSASKKIFI